MRKITLLLLTLLCMICICPMKTYATGSEIITNDENGIPDKGLYQAALRVLDKKENETFTKEEAESITRFGDWNSPYSYWDRWYLDIKNLKGIGYFKNLKVLLIDDHAIETLDGIEELTNLEELWITGHWLKDIKPLEQCTSLKIINLSSGKLENLDGIEKLTQLQSLNVGDNKLKNLRGIENLENLTGLTVEKNKLTNVEEVKGLKNLVLLNISQNKLVNVNLVKNLTNLEYLNISYNQIKKLPYLTQLTKIKYNNLNLTHNKLSKKEIYKKVPKELLKGGDKAQKGWVKDQINFQNLNYKLKITTPGSINKITSKTTKIAGKTIPNAKIAIWQEDRIYKCVKADKNGNFVMRNVDLKEYNKNDYVYFRIRLKHQQTGLWVKLQKEYKFKIKK